jgi:hypothetical protein
VIHEKNNSVHGTIGLEIFFEESSSLEVDTHCCENDSEVVFTAINNIFVQVSTRLFDKGSLSTNLGTDSGVGETGRGEERNLLTTGNRGHGINGGDTSLDHLFGIFSLSWINGLTLDIEEHLG